jgi:anti-anti-sigma regulatory factor
MNLLPRFDARSEIRTQLAAAIGLTRAGEPERAIDLLVDTAGCLANHPCVETFGADLGKAERLLIALQKRQIRRAENQLSARLAAMADIAPAAKVIVHVLIGVTPHIDQELERIYGRHGLHALILDLSQAVPVDADAVEFLVATRTKWQARGCFLGVVGQPVHASIPMFSTAAEAREYIAAGATGGISA